MPRRRRLNVKLLIILIGSAAVLVAVLGGGWYFATTARATKALRTAEQAFEEADVNHDSRISLDEFKAWYTQPGGAAGFVKQGGHTDFMDEGDEAVLTRFAACFEMPEPAPRSPA